MFKDYNKYLSTSIKVYLFVLIIIIILKLVGLDYFNLDITNPTIVKVDIFLQKTKLIYVLDFFSLYLMFYFYISIVCDSKKTKLISLISSVFNILLQFLLLKLNIYKYYSILSTLYMFILPSLICRKNKLKKSLILIVIITIYQLLSLFVRNQTANELYNLKIIDMILNIDQLLLLLITYKIYFMKGVKEKCQQEAGLFSQMKANLKNLPKKLLKNLHNYKKKPKQERIAISLYLCFSLLWNVISLVVVLLVAKLNHTFIECIFILTSFWLSKKSFGKAFHLPSMAQCFIVSNLTYYVLNRITTPLGVSILVPILLGVGLSYVTSKLVKKLYKPLYRGMPEELFEETILKVTDKNSDKYKICYEYYVLKKSAINLSMKYIYSEAGIRKITNRVNKQIKELNK